MPRSTAPRRDSQAAASVSWQHVIHGAVANDPLTALDCLNTAWLRAVEVGGTTAQMALSSNALAFMLVDWSRFTAWRQWITRFEEADAQLLPSNDVDESLARATGAVACALMRGDSLEQLTLVGERLHPLMNMTPASATNATQMALAARVLLPWLQMLRDIADAQALHARMKSVWQRWTNVDAAARYWAGMWLADWAQHLSFVDRARLPDAMRDMELYLDQHELPALKFSRARLSTETAFHNLDFGAADRGVRDMLATMHQDRPMDRVCYNSMAATLARSRNDIDTALLHMSYMARDLTAADCPPCLASVYRIRETGIHLFTRNYTKAAEIFEQCAHAAFTAHAAVIRGYASLARALAAYHANDANEGDALQHVTLCAHLRDGLGAMRRMPVTSFFVAISEARSTVCALAFREGIEVEFVRSALKQVPVPPPAWADEHWPWAMSLRCFGGFRNVATFAEGQVASKASSKLLHLLMLIAAHGAQGVPVSVATDALWPAQDGDQAQHTLTMTLVRLRRLFAEDDLIERDHGWLRLNTDKVWTDVRALEAHLEAAPDASAGSNEADLKRHIMRLFDLYRGDCLMGIDDVWAQDRAAHYRSRATAATRRIVRDASKAGHHDAVELALSHASGRGLDAAHILDNLPSNR